MYCSCPARKLYFSFLSTPYCITHILDLVAKPPQQVCSTCDTRLSPGKAVAGSSDGAAGAALVSAAVSGSTGASSAGGGAALGSSTACINFGARF